MIIDPVNATTVTVLWTASSTFLTQLVHTSYYTASGVVRSEYETILPPGVALTNVVIENDFTLDDSNFEIEHNFTLRYTITLHGVTSYGPVTTVTFTFGKCVPQIFKMSLLSVQQSSVTFILQIRSIFRFSLPIDFCLNWGVSAWVNYNSV